MTNTNDILIFKAIYPNGNIYIGNDNNSNSKWINSSKGTRRENNTGIISKQIGNADVDLQLFATAASSNSGFEILDLLVELATLGLKLLLLLEQVLPLPLHLAEPLLVTLELLVDQKTLLDIFLKN